MSNRIVWGKKNHQQQYDAHITKGDGGVDDAKFHLRNQSSGFPINAHIQDTANARKIKMERQNKP